MVGRDIIGPIHQIQDIIDTGIFVGQHDFGFGIESTSHVESIWSQLKTEILST